MGEETSGGVMETHERTWVAIVPKIDGLSGMSFEEGNGMEWGDEGVAREDSVGADRMDIFPILAGSPKRDMEAAALGVEMGREGEGGAGGGVVMQRVGGTGWFERRSLGARNVGEENEEATLGGVEAPLGEGGISEAQAMIAAAEFEDQTVDEGPAQSDEQ
jgi:hypothetical protein